MITVEQESILGLREPGERCICTKEKKKSRWGYYGSGWEYPENDSYITYVRINDRESDDVFLLPYAEDEPTPGTVKLRLDQYHPTLNPYVGDCFCCNEEVYHLLRHHCQDCNVLLCGDCILRSNYCRDRYVCYLCRVQVTKNVNAHYSAIELHGHATSSDRVCQLDDVI